MGDLRDSELRAMARVLTGIGAFSIFFILYNPSLTEGTMEISYEAIRTEPSNPIFEHLRKYDGSSDRRRRNATQTVSKPEELENVCNTTECFDAASTILKNMDTDVDPCDNFYRFACGGFLNRTIIPDGRAGVDFFSDFRELMDAQIKAIITAESKPGERKPFRKVKNFYKSYMNPTTREKEVELFRASLKKLGGWPVLDGDSWNVSDADWRSFLYKSIKTGNIIDYFLDFGIDIDKENPTKYIIYIDQPKLNPDHRSLSDGSFNDFDVSTYYSAAVDMAVVLGAQRDRAMKELRESLSFAMELAKISLSKEQRYDVTQLYNRMTVAELTRNYSSIPWKECFSGFLPSSITVEDDEVVIVRVPNYIRDLERLLSRTPNRVQANYAILRIAALTAFDSKDEYLREKAHALLQVHYDKETNASRSEKCVSFLLKKFPIIVDAMFVQYFNESVKRNAEAMVTNIKEQFLKNLETVDWMDEKTRESAIEKIAMMSSYLGYPDELFDDNKLEETYGNFEWSEENYYSNILVTKVFLRNEPFKKLREPYGYVQNDWRKYPKPTMWRARYLSSANKISLSPAVFQGLFSNKDLPKYMNYATIGFTIGHEITHGFDPIAIRLDKNGKHVEWLEPLAKEKYLNRTSCMIDQYANYTVGEVGLKVNGIRTLNENVADNGGMKVAYMAYKDWAEKNGPEPKLPGIDRTPQQMVWISNANRKCSVHRPKILKYIVNRDIHSPPEFRLLGSVSNMLEFARDFNCPVGSKMNPKKKCVVW